MEWIFLSICVISCCFSPCNQAKQNDPMAKYLPNERPKVKPEDKRENLIGNDVPVQRPISARERPFEAYVAAKEARENRYGRSLTLTCTAWSYP